MAMTRRILIALAMVSLLAPGAHGATFSAQRGLNLDLWVTWPAESDWSEASVLLPFPEWRRHLDKTDLAALKESGFDFLRMPIDPAAFLAESAAPLRDKLFAETLAAVRMVNAAGLKVIVDMHLIPTGGGRTVGMTEVMDDPTMFDRYVGIVRSMANALSEEDPKMVAFELMNEPVVDCDDDDEELWPDRQERLHAAARAAAPNLTLVLTGACWGGAEGLAKLDPADFADDNLMWDFHSYKPFLLTHQGALWAGDFIRYVTGLPYPPHTVQPAELEAALDAIRNTIRTEAPLVRRLGMLAYLDELMAEIDTKEELDAAMDRPFSIISRWAAEHGVDPRNILLGEFGMIRQEYGNDHIVPASDRAAYLKDMIARAEEAGFAWSIWSYGGAFGIVEAFGGQAAEPEVLEMVDELPPR